MIWFQNSITLEMKYFLRREIDQILLFIPEKSITAKIWIAKKEPQIRMRRRVFRRTIRDGFQTSGDLSESVIFV